MASNVSSRHSISTLGWSVLGELVNATRWLRIILIILGVFFVTRSVGLAKIH